MKVLIICPSIFYFGGPGHGLTNHAFYLWCYLLQRSPGLEVEVLDLERELSLPNTPQEVALFLQAAERMLARSDFDLVGISCWSSMNYLSTMAIARLCKRLNPEAPVVVGGYHPSVVPGDFCYPGTPVDYLVQGEGEEAFHRIVSGQVPLETRPQIVAGVPLALDELDLRWGEYKYHRLDTGFGLWLSRGCPFSCGFCLDRQSRWRGYSPARAMAEVERLLAACPRAEGVEFLDPLWGISREWRREFLARLVERAPAVRFGAETRVDLLDREDFELIGQLDFQVDLGVESVVPEILLIMQKTRDPARYLEAFWRTDELMTANHIPHYVYQILNYPGETTRTLDESLAFWERYFRERPGGYALPTPQCFKWFPGGEIASNWPAYEARFGARVLFPEWWKIEGESHFQLMSYIVPSRELAEAHRLDHWHRVSERIVQLAFASLAPEAHRRLSERLSPPLPVLQVRDNPGYLDGKPLRLSPKAIVQPRLNTTVSLYSFESNRHLDCSPQTTGIVRALLEDGATVRQLAAASTAGQPQPGSYLARLRTLVGTLFQNRMAVLALPPPGGEARPGAEIVFHTGIGPITVALDPATPLAAAALLHLAGLGYYDGVEITNVVPGAYAQVGPHARGQGVGFRFALDGPPGVPGRGALVLPRQGARPDTDGGQFYLVRETSAALAAGQGTIVGRVVAGMDVADRLLRGDYVARAEIRRPAAAPPGDPGLALGR